MDYSHVHWFVNCLWLILGFKQQSWVAGLGTTWPTKMKMLAIKPFTEKKKITNLCSSNYIIKLSPLVPNTVTKAMFLLVDRFHWNFQSKQGTNRGPTSFRMHVYSFGPVLATNTLVQFSVNLITDSGWLMLIEIYQVPDVLTYTILFHSSSSLERTCFYPFLQIRKKRGGETCPISNHS